MSYILDALKKSEKERTLGNIPTLSTTTTSNAKRVPLSWFVLAVTAVVLVVVGFGLWSMRQPTSGLEQMASPDSADTGATVQADATTAPQQKSAAIPVADLEPSIRNRLPTLDINVLSYSENRPKRFVMIDQNIYKEGERVSDGIVIEEITKTSVVMSFEDVRFLLFP